MEQALQEASSGSTTIRHAALEYGIPRSTLGNRISGHVAQELVHFLIGSVEIGYPKSMRNVRALIGTILSKQKTR